MKKLVIFFLLLLTYNISSAQTGWGYVNYTSYKTHNGNGSTTQYQAFPYSAAEFDNMLNTANSNTTITHTGEVPISYVYNGSVQTPHWSGDFYAIKFDFWFIPQETGTYYFGINSDDASDLSIDGTIIATYYGGHGAGGYQTGSKVMVAGQRYKVVVRYQEYGGGDALYFRWYRPVSGQWGYWNNEVTNINSVPTKQAKMNFDFGSTLNKTTFSVGGTALNSTGLVDITNSLDSVKIGNGYKGTMTSGQVEWSYVTNWDATRMLLNVDLRTFGAFQPSTITSMKIFDVYNGPVTYINSNTYWAVYSIPITIFTPGTYVRDMGSGSYAFKCDIAYTSNNVYKPQSVTMTTTNTLSTLYNSIVTVSDVYLAFKELQNGGIFGNEVGNEFTYGIQYKNADVNDDGVFNESDTYRMLQHLTGVKNIVDTFTFPNLIKIIPTTSYNTIGKSNWNTFPSFVGNTYNFDINTGQPTDTFNLSVTWKGDVNLSHSATPASNGITTMSVRTMNVTTIQNVESDIMMERVGENIVATIKINSNGNQIGATQFDVHFDNSVLEYTQTTFNNNTSTNFSKNSGSVISLGSLNTSNGSIGDMEYKVVFKPKTTIGNILGLISVINVETIDTKSNKLNIKVI